MSDGPVSGYPRLSRVAGNDVLYVSQKSGNTYLSKSVTSNNFFANVASNVSIHGITKIHNNANFTGSNSYFTSNVNITGGTLKINKLKIANSQVVLGAKLTPANSSISVTQFTLFFDSNYMYFATANNTLKRVALSSF
jgi:hypothetical protein